MSIILPLYIYPSPGAWNPLYTAAKEHPDVHFTVIVNPCSGPCLNGQLPDQVYLDEIPKLKTFDNIRTLGYVATHYTDKGLDDVLAEIGIYADWPKTTNNSRLRIDGIFFDETPSEFQQEAFEYLDAATKAVKGARGLGERFIVHNPGHIAPALLSSPNFATNSYLRLADITVVLEETFDRFLGRETFEPLRSHGLPRSKLAVILHSLPSLSARVVDFVVEQVEEVADWVFITDVTELNEYYHGFSSLFVDMIRAVDGGAYGW